MKLALLKFADISWICHMVEEANGSKRLTNVSSSMSVLFTGVMFNVLRMPKQEVITLLEDGDILRMLLPDGTYRSVKVVQNGLSYDGMLLDLSQFKEAEKISGENKETESGITLQETSIGAIRTDTHPA